MAFKHIKQKLKSELDAGHALDQIFYRKEGDTFYVGAIVITGPNFMTDAKRVDLGSFVYTRDAYKRFSDWHAKQMRRAGIREAI